jgi:hypothetical protein
MRGSSTYYNLSNQTTNGQTHTGATAHLDWCDCPLKQSSKKGDSYSSKNTPKELVLGRVFPMDRDNEVTVTLLSNSGDFIILLW